MKLDAWTWPRARGPEALVALAQAEGLVSGASDAPPLDDDDDLDAALAVVAERDRLDLDPLSFGRDEEMRAALARQAPLLLARGEGLLALGRVGVRHARLVAPDGLPREVPTSDLLSALAAEAGQAAPDPDLVALFAPLGAERGRRLARDVDAPASVGWRLTPSAEAALPLLLRRARLPRALVSLGLTYAGAAVALVGAWWVLGAGALSGRIDPGWLWAWALLLLTLVALRARALWLQGWIALEGGTLFRRRVLAAVQRQDVDSVRRQGAGELLGRVLETSALEELTLDGGFATLLAAVELALAWIVLGSGATAGPLRALVGLALCASLLGVGAHVRRRREWVRARVALTDVTVDGLLGLRTRVVQQDPARLHDDEDRLLARDYTVGRELDARLPILVALPPRALLLAGLLPLAAGAGWGAASTADLALGLGGLLLAERALGALIGGLVQLATAWIAWGQAAPLLATAPTPAPDPGLALEARRAQARGRARGQWLVAERLTFERRPGRTVLAECSLTVGPDQALVVAGASGAGKSTLLALLGGLLPPAGGSLSLHGLPPSAWGASAWRHAVALCPQFHENHLFAAPLAFNLLCGRRWSAHGHDLHEATELCAELGLGPLLARMPAGILQPVGEGGWQLSHGERARVFLARTLLQGADVVLLDESFAALDPDTLSAALAAARSRAPALLVVAHP